MDQDLSKPNKVSILKAIDDNYSQRFIALDPEGYFLIRVNKENKELIVEHFTNNIDELGRAINPETGKPFECKHEEARTPKEIFTGRTAKEVGIKLTEGEGPHLISKLDHALYLGRELQRAEHCLFTEEPYIQD